jgi:RHS repeat-associated protein
VSVNGTTLLSSVLYEPFGPVSGWTLGNGTLAVRTYDTDGKITQVDSGGLDTYAYDDALRITGITDTVNGANSYTYGYDALDRLTSAVKSGTTRGWSYDANGNRLGESGSFPSTYTISGTSNRLSSISGTLSRSYGYDASGNVLTDGNVTATYNNRGRLSTLTANGSTESILYNALGQRVKVSGGVQGTVLYLYDEAGHLLGEYDGSGNLLEETVWLGDTPVATLRPNGSTVSVYYVHTDHLNTPRRITRTSDNAVLWTWSADPFGSELPNENPQGAGTFSYNQRFPGQIYDAQAGLSYNDFRDYDPAIGRYVESDPIGLAGGINTFGYVGGNPPRSADPSGLLPGGFGTPGIRAYEALQRRQPDECGCERWPDYITFHIDLYVLSVSATYTRAGDIFLGKGFNRQYLNPAEIGVSISGGWLLKCNPTIDDINNFLIGWSASAGAYPLVGGSYSVNTSGSAINIGVGAGRAKASVSPGIINTYQGNIFGTAWR